MIEHYIIAALMVALVASLWAGFSARADADMYYKQWDKLRLAAWEARRDTLQLAEDRELLEQEQAELAQLEQAHREREAKYWDDRRADTARYWEMRNERAQVTP